MIELYKNKFIDSRYINIVSNWYLSHTERDRLIIKAVTALMMVSFVWILIVQPLVNWHKQQKAIERSTYALLNTIKINANQLVKSKTNSSDGTANNTALVPIITKTASLNKIQLSRLQPGSDDAVIVYVEKQRFSSVLKWFVQLKENNQIQINSVSIESEDGNGLVSAQISFIR